MSKPLKIAAIGVIVILATCLSLYYYNFIYGSLVSTDSIYIEQASFHPYEFCLEGSTTNSALGFAGYSISREGDKAYIKLRFALSSRWHPHGAIAISEGEYLEGVHEVYLVGNKKGDLKLIWIEQ